jgi:hypothetical protein
MSQQVTLQVSEQVIRQAAQVAVQTHQSVEDVLAAWLESVTTERSVEELPDDEVLALADLRLTDEQDASLSELLERNREGALDADGQRELDEMMRLYEHGLLRKSQALKVAVQRGLREPLQAWAGRTFSEVVRQCVREAAGERCGYCLSPQRLVMGQLEIGHLFPRARGGNGFEFFSLAKKNGWRFCRQAYYPQATLSSWRFNRHRPGAI